MTRLAKLFNARRLVQGAATVLTVTLALTVRVEHSCSEQSKPNVSVYPAVGVLPAPDASIFWIDDFADEGESALLEHTRRCVGLGHRVGDDLSHFVIVAREVDESSRGFGGVAASLEGRNNAVGYLDHSGCVGWPLEAGGADHVVGVLVDDGEAEFPGVGTLYGAKARCPRGGDIRRNHEIPKTRCCREAGELLESCGLLNQGEKIFRRIGTEQKMLSLDQYTVPARFLRGKL